jgi:hypothetical protein
MFGRRRATNTRNSHRADVYSHRGGGWGSGRRGGTRVWGQGSRVPPRPASQGWTSESSSGTALSCNATRHACARASSASSTGCAWAGDQLTLRREAGESLQRIARVHPPGGAPEGFGANPGGSDRGVLAREAVLAKQVNARAGAAESGGGAGVAAGAKRADGVRGEVEVVGDLPPPPRRIAVRGTLRLAAAKRKVALLDCVGIAAVLLAELRGLGLETGGDLGVAAAEQSAQLGGNASDAEVAAALSHAPLNREPASASPVARWA